MYKMPEILGFQNRNILNLYDISFPGRGGNLLTRVRLFFKISLHTVTFLFDERSLSGR